MWHVRRIGLMVFLILLAGCNRNTGVVPQPSLSEPAWFEDVTARAGLKFQHDCGPITSSYFMPQMFGSGCAFFDFDGDDRLDIFLLHNGGPSGAKYQLFQQQTDGTFRDVSVGSGLDVAGYGMGVAIGDVNNDGRPDIAITEYGATRLFVNERTGRFREVTRAAGLDNPQWGTSCAFFDYDRDGNLDLVIANYVDYDKSIKCTSRGGKLDFCGPNFFGSTVARLFRNLGSAAGMEIRFEDVTAKAGFGAAKGKGLGVLCADFDGDRWPDILLANDMMANHLWINQRNGTFREEAIKRGIAYTVSGASAANMGTAWADVDGNGLFDVFITHLVDETHTLWKQNTPGFFEDRTIAAGLTTGRRSTGFGTAFVDLDRDGWVDLPFVNGAVVRNPTARDSDPFWSQYVQRNQLYANLGKGKFREISEHNPALCGFDCVGRGLAVGDFDNDGAPDLLVTEIAGGARLLRNIAPANGHWLGVRAILPKHRRDAYGAEIRVRAGGATYARLLYPGYSYCSSSDPRCFFGLGQFKRYDGITVIWPDGTEELFAGGAADRQVELRQGQGSPASNPKR